MTNCIVVLVTAPSPADAERIAEAVVGEHLAACVNRIGPIRSTYFWEGEVQRDEEWLLVIKTQAARFAELAARVRALHTYQTPEIIALPIVDGSAPYLEWVRAATGSGES
jgi:periplasmic divalent cation tolerance protein